MKNGTDLVLHSVASNSSGLRRVPGLHADNLRRDAGLRIRVLDSGRSFLLGAYGPAFAPPETWDAELPLTQVKVFGHVEDCRRAWKRTAVDRQETAASFAGAPRKRCPFQREWDLSRRPELPGEVLPQLALAGDRLFYHLFEEDGTADLRRIAGRLRELSASSDMVMTITSDGFFVPWGMLYTHPAERGRLLPDGSNACAEGFWGYRHIIEHNPEWIPLETRIRPRDGALRASLNVDATLDTQLHFACIAEQRAFVGTLPYIRTTERRLRRELETAMSDPSFADQIVYFCCHGTGGSADGGPSVDKARLSLSDHHHPFTGDEISYWLRDRSELPTHPLVFINACQGGQMTTIFYETMAAIFLKRKAVGLIGSQIDIPAVFAARYAIELFRRFFSMEPGRRVRLGPTMRELTRTFMNEHNNPLGLVYSLYRGADCFVDWSDQGGRPEPA